MFRHCGVPFLETIEAAATERVIVSTPNAHYLREAHDTLVGFNPLEAHLSEVPRSLLAGRGYTVRGAGFGRYDSRVARRAKRLRVRARAWCRRRGICRGSPRRSLRSRTSAEKREPCAGPRAQGKVAAEREADERTA